MDIAHSDYMPQTVFLHLRGHPLQKGKSCSIRAVGRGELYSSAHRKRRGQAIKEAKKRDRESFESATYAS